MLKNYYTTYSYFAVDMMKTNQANDINSNGKNVLNINTKINNKNNNNDNNNKYQQLISPNDTINDDMVNILTSHDIDNLRKSFQNGNNYKCDFGCHFDKKSQEEIEKAVKARKKLLFASIFCVIFMIAELIGGFLAGSIALMSDALHLLSDCGGLMISVVALV